jgi:hypothetical protein
MHCDSRSADHLSFSLEGGAGSSCGTWQTKRKGIICRDAHLIEEWPAAIHSSHYIFANFFRRASSKY